MRAMGIKTRCTDVITLTFGLMMVGCHHLLFIFYSTLFWLCFSRWIFVPAASYYEPKREVKSLLPTNYVVSYGTKNWSWVCQSRLKNPSRKDACSASERGIRDDDVDDIIVTRNLHKK